MKTYIVYAKSSNKFKVLGAFDNYGKASRYADVQEEKMLVANRKKILITNRGASIEIEDIELNEEKNWKVW